MAEKKQEQKIKMEIALTEASDWLRDLADRLDAPSAPPGDEGLPELGDFSKIKIGLKRIGDRVKVKVNVKRGTPADSEEMPAGTNSYKSLKKSMKKHFKAIKEHLAAGNLPPADAVAAFLSESDRMIRFPGFGDEYYEMYRAACFRFREAHRTADIAACKTVCDELDRLKTECHDRYK